ncbi:hypothetical protein CEP52_004869 [Fusarium oligoseptatum]|uniref:Uncharacterized protein n=1 Tax=Fusarium oligoseptatum TaxID=2604345 RepID=A0A428U1Q4_9HYPO|nr:hypothetical protein CEP52_004869 [Fusarium oligoseptatum]
MLSDTCHACNECLTLNLSKDQKIFTKHVPKSSELGREYGTVPKKFLTLEKILNTNKSDQAEREVMRSGMMRRFYTRLMAMVSRTPKQELNDQDVVTVQYLLSESVLHLYDSPWLVDIWQPGHIEFPKDGTLLDFRRPHYPSPLLIDSLEESMPDQVTILDPDDYAEKFMAKFGLLLLQLQLRQRFPLETKNQSDELWAPIALGIQNSLVCNTTAQDEPQQVLDTQLREGTTRVERNGTSSKVAPYSHALGGTMLKRSGPATSTEWFNNLEVLNEYLTAHACEVDEPYETNRVKIAVIDSGLWEGRQGDANITYKNFIKEGKYKDNPQHGTNSVDLICKVYGRAELYVAKVFEGNEARGNTSKYMAEAIKWAISKKVDIISISAGFKQEGHGELEAQIKMATAGGAEPEILVFAAASNWQNISGVAYPASMTDRVICIFCCNGGLKPSRQWNPNPRNNAANFAFLGEDVILDSGPKPLCGTSVSTALAAGLAAKLLDFSRQPDVQSWISKASREKMRTKAGMSAIFKEMSRKNVSEKYECVAPWKILPAQLDHGRKKIREAICTIIEKAME